MPRSLEDNPLYEVLYRDPKSGALLEVVQYSVEVNVTHCSPVDPSAKVHL